jgi:hypothetical protein
MEARSLGMPTKIVSSKWIGITSASDTLGLKHTRWVDAVQLKRGENEEVYLTFSPSLGSVGKSSIRAIKRVVIEC